MKNNIYLKIFTNMALYIGLVSDDLLESITMGNGIKNLCKNDIPNNPKGAVFEKLNDINVTGLYLMQHMPDGCRANCAFCVQSRASTARKKKSYLVDNQLIRVPLQFFTDFIKDGLLESMGFTRICIQTVYNSKTVESLVELVRGIHSVCEVPITACCIPVSRKSLIKLKEAGLDWITINYEVATPELFTEIRGEKRNAPYRWDKVSQALEDASYIFGESKVGSHLQVGLGETQEEALRHIQKLKDKKILVSLFAFRPLPETDLANWERISYRDYHMLQLGSYLIQKKNLHMSNFSFDENSKIIDYGISTNDLYKLIESGIPFKNAGCPGCNRIYYETNPGERIYSYPRDLYPEEVNTIKEEILGNLTLEN